MEIIIEFFRGIDGWPYYIVLVVNTILIFAIIGYIGEKSNEELAKVSASKGASNIKSGTMNLTPVHTSNDNNATTVSNMKPPQVAVPTAPVVPAVPNANPANIMTNNTQVPVVNNNTGSVNNEIAPNEKAPAVLVINGDGMNKDVK